MSQAPDTLLVLIKITIVAVTGRIQQKVQDEEHGKGSFPAEFRCYTKGKKEYRQKKK
jgi:hypothetical protein